jgi:iron complex outermembrane recepter protein
MSIMERRQVMRKGLGAFFVVLVILLSTGLHAEEVQRDSRSDVVMKEVVVTGTRFEERIERIPANITVIDEEDIRNSNARSLPDLLRSQEGVVVRDILSTGKTAQVDLRGFGESAPYNVLVLVDGRRVNEIDLSGVDWTQIPIENIERIEILRGTGSVLYGDNAVGGVINIITKTPSQDLAFSAGATFGSYGLHGERFSLSGGQGKFTGSLYGTYESTDGYRENNDYRAKDLGGKIIFDATDSLLVNLSGSYHKDDYGLPGPLPKDILESDRKKSLDPADKAKTEDSYLKLGLDMDLEKYGNLVADLSYRDRESRSDFPDSLFPYVLDSTISTWAFTPRHVWRTDISGHANTLIAGADFYRSEQDLKTYSGFFSSVTSLTGTADIAKDSYGFYLNDEFSVTNTLILSVGARYEKAEYDLHQRDLSAFPLAPLDGTVKDSENAYHGGLTWLYRDKSSLFIRANRSFRFPLSDEVVLFDYTTGSIRVNTDLKPQTADHYEVGIRHYFTPLVQANVTLFRADMNDEIFYNRATFTNENYEETLHQGVEIGGRAELFKYLTLFGSYTYQKVTFEEGPFDGNDIPAVPKNKFSAGLRLHDVYPGLVFSALCNYVGKSRLISDQANLFDELPSYYTIDLKVSYAWKWINAFAGVNNLTDRTYSEYGVIGGFVPGPFFYPAAERNWLAGLQFVF